jgi:hypothetical protein
VSAVLVCAHFGITPPNPPVRRSNSLVSGKTVEVHAVLANYGEIRIAICKKYNLPVQECLNIEDRIFGPWLIRVRTGGGFFPPSILFFFVWY